MKTFKISLFLFLLFIISSYSAFSQGNNGNLPTKGVFWKISGNGLEKPSYLLGTLHRPEAKAILDSIPEILTTLETVDCFVPEIVPKDQLKTLEIKKKANADHLHFKPWPSRDSTYQNLLSKEQYDKLLNVKLIPKEEIELLTQFLSPLSLYNMLKLQSKASELPKRENYSSDSLFWKANKLFADSVKILDTHLVELAKDKYGKEVVPLETSEEQINLVTLGASKLLPSISYKDEIDLLMNYVENHAEIDSLEKAEIGLENSHYLNQDLAALASTPIRVDFPQADLTKVQEFVHHGIDTRNNLWMEKIPDLIEAKSCFIMVGAAHLVNESGLINQLRKLGYSVERIE